MSDALEIIPINIEDELKQSYLDYAMSVIVGRALPNVYDGLKPVHRRVLYAMYQLGNDWNKAFKKSARIVGDVIGKYHPHGESAVYDSMVRMAQPFTMRYLLIDGQGNFGSVDGDPPAAMRYTEVRMTKIAHLMLSDIDKDTVNFVPNYDETEMQPSVLPARIPNLLVNGTSGIAVGMATHIPPHNLVEVIDACLALIKNPELELDELMRLIPGPDFPTAAIINGKAGIVSAYKTGKGKVIVRSRTEIEVDEKTNRQAIIVTELPYQVNKARLLEKIAELVKDKKVEGISALRDESDKDGMRVVIEIKKAENIEVIKNNLFSQTQLQIVYGINMVALVDGQPKLLSLKEILNLFIKHRRQIVVRRTSYELNKALERAHILEGLSVALINIDPIIETIKKAKTAHEAKQALTAHPWPALKIITLIEKINPNKATQQDGLYALSETQAQAILDMRLQRLTGLEQDKIMQEYTETISKIEHLRSILKNPNMVLEIIENELLEIKNEFGDKRRTEIVSIQEDLSLEDLITEEDMVVTLSQQGYVKSQPLSLYQAQKRGGKGKIATAVKEEDYITKIIIANSHDTLLCFSSLGKVYWVKTHQLPIAARTAKGKPIINLLPLSEGEFISAILPIQEYATNKYVFMCTRSGMVKKVELQDFARPRANGIIAIDLIDNDTLVGAELTTSDADVLISTNTGKAIRFSGTEVRSTGRSSRGVRGIKLNPEQFVISLIIIKEGGTILTATANGFGKRTNVEDFSRISRGGQGVIAIQTNERNGELIGALQVFPQDELMLISNQGTLVRTRIDEISIIGRNTQGVTLINLAEDEHLVGIQRIVDEDLL